MLRSSAPALPAWSSRSSWPAAVGASPSSSKPRRSSASTAAKVFSRVPGGSSPISGCGSGSSISTTARRKAASRESTAGNCASTLPPFSETTRRHGRSSSPNRSCSKSSPTRRGAHRPRSSSERRSKRCDIAADGSPGSRLPSAPGAANDLVYVQSEGANLTIAFPSRRRRLQVGWLVPKDAPRPGRDELIRRAPPEAARLLRDELESGAEPVLLPIASEVVTAWWRPGLLLIGDAAHPMSPVAAQGINVAVQDAVVAARHLADANDEAALDRALPHIERERTGSIHRIARQQNAFVLALHRIGPARAVYFGISAAIAVERIGLFPFIGRPLLDRFLWGDPPIRADAGPWSLVAKDSSIGAR